MNRQISLIVTFSILLFGVSFVGNGFADSGKISFDSDFGKYGISQPGSFLSPQHLAFDSENNLYVTDLGNARVQKFDSNGNFLLEWGSKGTQSGNFGHPSGIVISNEGLTSRNFELNPAVAKGSIDGDSIIDLADAILALQVLAGMEPSPVFKEADVNEDGKIGLEEVIYILQEVGDLR